MRIALVQLAYGDDEPTAARIERAAELVAQQRGHDLVVLPELWAPTGFDYGRWDGEAEPLDGPLAAAMADAARAAGATLHAGSFVERLPEPGADGNTLSNTSLVLSADGERVALYRKVHRFGFGAGEPRLMEAGEDVVVVDLPDGAGGTVRTGLSTCYDLRFPELYRRQQEAGASLLVVPAAWPLARVAHWTLLGRARAVEDQCVMVQVNTGGTHARTPMGGHSQVVAATGEVLGELAHTDEAVLSVEVDLAATAAYREAFPVLADRRL
ncbi:nitrilase-related carbon-nitrogen hydrolase [Arthrobacter sp. NEB 688]|uniref:nitrilase-related carbon-nitrogen hydrolase n=1 Tax=Arthrobacter sp. NEB 688 TaxID=904039 RepID=UPI00156735CB|nr:nitrilase-related carbon-nitrogen hydrolase [Arthrobacter sp. NEB 688]QKE82959.1 apolipoprotein acyltransferase [Arthrobacter sp. NEB 688]